MSLSQLRTFSAGLGHSARSSRFHTLTGVLMTPSPPSGSACQVMMSTYGNYESVEMSSAATAVRTEGHESAKRGPGIAMMQVQLHKWTRWIVLAMCTGMQDACSIRNHCL